MQSHEFISLIFLALSIFSPLQVFAQAKSVIDHSIEPSSPFSIALETLQSHIGYDFQSIGLLRRAMTHPSFSEESNKALSILGANVIETSVSLQSLTKNLDISSKDLNRLISEMSNVESSCAVDGMRLALQKVVRVSPKTNSSAPSVVCGAFRAIFGAIAVDTQMADEAGNVFWRVHSGQIGRALGL
ncbi:Protein NUCLEAR FUSION DEFECTIVE 2 [Camellia lanceoleosa]|uniref:Protein NUCLEAR FUSION DEFECTIVE 2 n=1 Tax=Camellia lanceoleosa TaxID=1840588 RepID=A0ACC0I1Z3_9ERIC|nr:Protein NUCLEAR FUSION DEFECTIVE 2 [Camellia lanceoleosa]